MTHIRVDSFRRCFPRSPGHFSTLFYSVQPTNNFAEQLIRSYVLWRKSSFGTQSDRGDLFVERMMTVTTTCKLQQRNRYDYINSAVAAYLRNEPAPSILYQEELTVPDKIAA